MNWLTFVAGAVVSRGVRRDAAPGSSLFDARAVGVGVAYFSIGVLVGRALIAQGQDSAVSTRRARPRRPSPARSARSRGLHHLFLPHRRDADLRDAAFFGGAP